VVFFNLLFKIALLLLNLIVCIEEEWDESKSIVKPGLNIFEPDANWSL